MRGTSSTIFLILLALSGVWSAHAQSPAAAAAPRATDGANVRPGSGRLRPLEVSVNLTRVGEWTLLENEEGLFATADMIKEWRLAVPLTAPALAFRGQQWLPLFVLPGYRARIDFATQSLELEFSASAFEATQLGSTRSEAPPLSPKEPALFVNYDVSHSRAKAAVGGVSRSTGVLSELGLSYGPGVLLSSFVGRNIGSNDPLLKQEFRRLETTWTLDQPESNRTLRLGDTSTRASLWGRSLYFGGLQIGSNFSLTPGFVAQALPTVTGTANGPSTVELYVNDVLRQTANVQAGPFMVENFNQLSGAGEVRVVVRDVLGRESVVTRSFFTNANLLAPGMVDWSIDVGRLRYNLASINADYRDVFASGLYRRGLTDDMTLEARLDYSRTLRNAGLGGTFTLPLQALGQAAVVTSQSATLGSAGKLFFGFDQQSLNSGFGLRVALAERNYRDLGASDLDVPYRREQAANFRYQFGESGAIGVTAASILAHDGGAINSSSLSYSMRAFERGALTLTLSHVSGQASATTFIASLMLPLDGRRTITSSMSRKSGVIDGYASLTEPIDGQTGTGYRVLGGRRAAQNYAEGGIYHQGSKMFVSADVNASAATQNVRLNAQGALVWIDGAVFASRRLAESFALIDVKGYGDVGVGFQGGSLTQTDKNGLAMLPRLAPYQVNNVRLNPNDLPFSAEVDNIELTAVPAWRSAVKLVFPVRTGRGGLLRIVFDDGQPAPAGATLKLPGDDKEFFVARRGEAYVTGMPDKAKVELRWKDKTCVLDVELPPSLPDEIPRLGPFICKGVPR